MKLELDRYIGQPIYIGRYQYQADISYRLFTTDKYRLTLVDIRLTIVGIYSSDKYKAPITLQEINNALARRGMYRACTAVETYYLIEISDKIAN